MGIKLFTFYSYWNFPVLVQTYNLKYTEGTATFTIFSNVWFLYFNLTKSVGTIYTNEKSADLIPIYEDMYTHSHTHTNIHKDSTELDCLILQNME